MISVEKNLYFLKQSDGTIWNFAYDKRLGIIYKIYRDDKWLNYSVLTRETTGKYSAELLPNDKICIIYESLTGQLIMKLFNNSKWKSHYLVNTSDNEKIDIYFKTIVNNNNLFLFYSIYNKDKNIVSIYSNLIDEKGTSNSQSLIDQINFEHNILFSLCPANDDNIYIMYQLKENNYILGYKIFNMNSRSWSEFYKIDSSLFKFEEYSLLYFRENFHSIYTKTDANKSNYLNYCKGNLSSHNYTTISRNKNIITSSLFIIGDYIWCFWLKNNELISTVSLNEGASFSKPYQSDIIHSKTLYKVSYISNFLENNHTKHMGEVFIENINSPNLLLIDTIFGLIDERTKNTSHSFYLHYFISSSKVNNEIPSKVNNIITKIDSPEKDLLIKEQKDTIEQQKNKLLSYENKFNSINELVNIFNENSLQLYEGVSTLQDNLDDKNKKYHELRKIYYEKETELELLKSQLKKINLQKSSIFDIKKIFTNLFSSNKD
jgi:hypothetical protein